MSFSFATEAGNDSSSASSVRSFGTNCCRFKLDAVIRSVISAEWLLAFMESHKTFGDVCFCAARSHTDALTHILQPLYTTPRTHFSWGRHFVVCFTLIILLQNVQLLRSVSIFLRGFSPPSPFISFSLWQLQIRFHSVYCQSKSDFQ